MMDRVEGEGEGWEIRNPRLLHPSTSVHSAGNLVAFTSPRVNRNSSRCPNEM